ncbi:MAG: type II toxin-antitoxin system HicA family toxin [bacterium]|nr:type II toxin-antitoxin system HicA family toxin [bacterium]
MKPLTAKQIIKILTSNGFVLSRQKGSHRIYTHKESGIMVPIPMHAGNKPVFIGTFLEIIKQSKILRKKFMN